MKSDAGGVSSGIFFSSEPPFRTLSRDECTWRKNHTDEKRPLTASEKYDNVFLEKDFITAINFIWTIVFPFKIRKGCGSGF